MRTRSKDYPYLVAIDMTWRALDSAQTRTLRWLIEVFFDDWKAHHGGAKLAKPPGEEGLGVRRRNRLAPAVTVALN